jgi:hypothetical protein
LKHFALPAGVALVRLDGHYGDAAVIAQLMLTGVYLVTRGRGESLLEHQEIQGVLAHPPIASVSATNTGEVVELFGGGWLPPYRGLPAGRFLGSKQQSKEKRAREKRGDISFCENKQERKSLYLGGKRCRVEKHYRSGNRPCQRICRT